VQRVSREAEERIDRFGPNRIGDFPTSRMASKVWRRVSEPLVAILLVGDLPSVVLL
jgi:Cation transporter/ATPase, N-terminus